MPRNQKDYWNNRYERGLKSRSGKGLNPVWSFINNYAKKEIKEKCLDVGCGDLSFWKIYKIFYRTCKDYTGIDLSNKVISKNRLNIMFKNKTFVCANSGHTLRSLIKKYRVVLCIDVLFHIMDKDDYENTLHNICEYSRKWLFITEWYKEPELYDKDYQKFWNFEKYINTLMASHNFMLWSYMHLNPYGKLYLFKWMV
jgi:hypothetical protein